MNQYSSAERPDLDWSQVRETVKLLTISVTQVENSLHVSENSVDTLTASFTGMVDHLNAIAETLNSIEDNDARQVALQHCAATNDKIRSSIIAFQFYDRLQQCLTHVTQSLKGLSELVESPDRLYNPAEWRKFQGEIRSRFTMESEKIMFDAVLSGKSINEALALASAMTEATPTEDEDDIELF